MGAGRMQPKSSEIEISRSHAARVERGGINLTTPPNYTHRESMLSFIMLITEDSL
jgi:hypothetical protein